MADTPHRSPARVLVVDDDVEVLAVLTEVLGAAGHVVEPVTDSRQALTRLGEGAFDAVVSDVQMPGLSGVELHDAVARDHPRLAERFILVSGDAIRPELPEFVDRTGVPVLAKPFDIREIMRLVQAILDR
jgi:two-component system, NtrC family, sensor kinase